MPDDPREILKAAGVECAEVEAWAEQVFTGEFSEMKTASEALSIIGPLRDVVVTSNVAILAVAQLAAKYKSAYEAERGHVLRGPTGTEWIRQDLAEEEIAKYKWAAESLQTDLLQAALDHDFSIPTLAARLAQYEADHA